MTAFYAPNSSFTYAQAINNGGVVTGYYAYSGTIYGFTRTGKGVLTAFAVPNVYSTQPFSINDSGVIAGSCSDAAGHHGFVRTR
jgi:hypothetical protein